MGSAAGFMLVSGGIMALPQLAWVIFVGSTPFDLFLLKLLAKAWKEKQGLGGFLQTLQRNIWISGLAQGRAQTALVSIILNLLRCISRIAFGRSRIAMRRWTGEGRFSNCWDIQSSSSAHDLAVMLAVRKPLVPYHPNAQLGSSCEHPFLHSSEASSLYRICARDGPGDEWWKCIIKSTRPFCMKQQFRLECCNYLFHGWVRASLLEACSNTC